MEEQILALKDKVFTINSLQQVGQLKLEGFFKIEETYYITVYNETYKRTFKVTGYLLRNITIVD